MIASGVSYCKKFVGIVSSLQSSGEVVWSCIWLFGRGCCPTRAYRYAKTRVGLFHKHPILLAVKVSDKSIQFTRYYLVIRTANLIQISPMDAPKHVGLFCNPRHAVPFVYQGITCPNPSYQCQVQYDRILHKNSSIPLARPLKS